MSASLISGKTGKSLVDLIRRNYITAGTNVQITSRDERGTFLRRKSKISVCDCIEGMEAIYCVVWPGFGGGFTDPVAIQRSGTACSWCGMTPGAPDETNDLRLSIRFPGGPSDDTCQWWIGLNDYTVAAFKPFNGGDPRGDYYRYDDYSGGVIATVSVGCGMSVSPCLTCDPPWCAIQEITIQATLSGTLDHKDDGCGGGTPFSISAVTPTATCTPAPGLDCLGSCTTEAVPIDYTCDPECYPISSSEDPTFRVEVGLGCPGEDGGDWFLDLNVDINQSGGENLCQSNRLFGGDIVLEVNLGADPSGTHTLSFDDPNQGSVHYDVVVVVTR